MKSVFSVFASLTVAAMYSQIAFAEIKPGDNVMTNLGTKCKVVAVSPDGKSAMVKLGGGWGVAEGILGMGSQSVYKMSCDDLWKTSSRITPEDAAKRIQMADAGPAANGSAIGASANSSSQLSSGGGTQ